MSLFLHPKSTIRKNTNTASLLRLRETNSISKNRGNLNKLVLFPYTDLYKVNGQTNIDNILKYKPDIELNLFEIVDNKVELNIYDSLHFTNDNFYAQNVIYSDDERGDVIHSFDLIGKLKGNKSSGSYNANTVVLNDIQAEHLYTDKFFSKLYLFTHDYYNTYYIVQREAKKIKEENIYKNFIKKHRLNLIDDKTNYNNPENVRMQDPNYKLFNFLDNHINSRIKSRSSKITNSHGGSNSVNKVIYIKMLRNKTLQQLQKLAKNKKVKYTKKVDGKTVEIKKETLIRKLCTYKYKK